MKRIALATVCLAAAVSVGYVKYPTEFTEYAGEAKLAALKLWDQIQSNPFPVSLAVGTFLLTVIYQKARGKSLRESVEAAATRVVVVPVPSKDGSGEENPVVKRAQARATRTQLLADQNGIENRYRKLPEEILKIEKDACYSEQAVADAEKKLAERKKSFEEVSAKLQALRKEKAQSEAELTAIRTELKKLSQIV